jgi:hypothetical protein
VIGGRGEPEAQKRSAPGGQRGLWPMAAKFLSTTFYLGPVWFIYFCDGSVCFVTRWSWSCSSSSSGGRGDSCSRVPFWFFSFNKKKQSSLDSRVVVRSSARISRCRRVEGQVQQTIRIGDRPINSLSTQRTGGTTCQAGANRGRYADTAYYITTVFL